MVDRLSYFFAVVAVFHQITAQERVAVPASECNRTKNLTHTKLADHRSCDFRCSVEIAVCTGGKLAEDQSFSGTSTQQSGDIVEKLALSSQILVCYWELHGITESHTSGQNR